MTAKKPKAKKPPMQHAHVLPRVVFMSIVKELADLRVQVELSTKVSSEAGAAITTAVARKPNAVLQELVYLLRLTRVELAMVQEELAKNNALLQRFVSAVPVAVPGDPWPLGTIKVGAGG